MFTPIYSFYWFWFPITEVPVFGTCPIRQSINTDPGQPTAVANWTNPTATDNTGGIPHVNCYPQSGAAFPIGVNNVTCYAKSINGLVGSCGFDLIVTGNVQVWRPQKERSFSEWESSINTLIFFFVLDIPKNSTLGYYFIFHEIASNAFQRACTPWLLLQVNQLLSNEMISIRAGHACLKTYLPHKVQTQYLHLSSHAEYFSFVLENSWSEQTINPLP